MYMSNIKEYQSAVNVIKTAILQSQARAAKAVNQEQLALYYGIGRYVSANTRKKNWGQGAIEAISNQLKQELPGLRGFSARNIKNMRIFYEGWNMLERPNSAVTTAKFTEINNNSAVETDGIGQAIVNSAVATAEFEDDREIRQLQLANLPDFPLKEFLSISFTHHIAILAKAKAYDERVFYMKYADSYKPTVEELETGYIMQDFKQPMGVATYKTADEMDPELLKALPPKEELQRVFDESSKKEE